jgi:aryl sulfotransferase
MTAQLPKKTRELHTNHFDSTIWNDFKFRGDDIVISTYAKSGTTWMQQMIGQMLFGPDPNLPVSDMSPWLDLRIPPSEVKLQMVEAQMHRRFLKTHLPVDALVFSPRAKYVYIGRDGRDVLWSLYNHHATANDLWYKAINESPGLIGPPVPRPSADILQYWNEWMERDGYPFWSLWENVRSWWAIRNLPNVKFVHFADLKRDMDGQMRGLARFLDIAVDEKKWPRILELCSFDWMKANGAKSVPLNGALWEGGAQSFINKGVNGRWQSTLSAAQSAEYEARAVKELGADCARWLKAGGEAA